MRRALLVVVVVVVVAAAGYGVLHWRHSRSVPAAGQARPVSTYTVQAGNLQSTVSGSGSTAAVRDQNLVFGTSGQVVSVAVKDGQKVTAGQVLAQLDDTQAQLSVTKAQQTYDADLIGGSKNQVQQDKLSLDAAKQELQKTLLTAPFAGIVSDVAIQSGDYVSASATALRLIDPSQYLVDVDVDETDIAKVKLDQNALVTFDAYKDLRLGGHVTKIGYAPKNSNGVVLFPVEITLDKVDDRLRPGLTAEADVVVEQARDVPLVPIESITEVGNRQMVTKVANDGSQQRVPIETGLSNGLFVEVKSGLQVGDKIVGNNIRFFQAINGGNNPTEAAQAGNRRGFGGPGGFGGGVAVRAFGGGGGGRGGRG